MCYLSIIVPTYKEELGVHKFLSDLIAKTAAIENHQIIIVDSGDDKTKVRAIDLAEQQGLTNIKVIHSGKGRALQMNIGADCALSICDEQKNHVLLFVHSDTQLPVDMAHWWRGINEMQPKWGFFRIKLSGEAWPFRAIEWFMNWRSTHTSIGTGDQCLYLWANVWRDIGGFKEIELMEDVDLCKRLRVLDRPDIHLMPVITSSRRWQERGIVRTVALMWTLRLGYFLGLSPARLSRFYKN